MTSSSPYVHAAQPPTSSIIPIVKSIRLRFVLVESPVQLRHRHLDSNPQSQYARNKSRECHFAGGGRSLAWEVPCS